MKSPVSLSALKIGVTGASGFVGRALVAELKRHGADVYPFVRSGVPTADSISWQPTAPLVDQALFRSLDAVVHLAGEPIVGRWTASKKERIYDSRVKGTSHLAEALQQLERPVTFISASGIGYYGTQIDLETDESGVLGDGFLAQVCRDWETAACEVQNAHHRVAVLRIGLVLGRNGGALAKMITPFKFMMGGQIGNGHQWMSWISIDDLISVIVRILSDEDKKGVFNAVGPHPVTNRVFTKALGRALSRPTVAPVPRFVLKTVFGEMAEETLLASQRVIPKRLLDDGFHFKDQDLDVCLGRLVTNSG